MEISAEQGRRAFAHWLRTGLLPAVCTADGIELKFNPYHDPQNGRFTFGPGGTAGTTKPSSRRFGQHASLVASEAEREPARGSNSRAFEIRMTLEQSFPGLRNSPGGALIAVADNLFDFTGPANESMTQFLQDQSRQLTSQIKAIDPNWHYDEMGPTDAFGTPIITVQGLSAKVDDLRFQRAAVVARVKGDYRPLQVDASFRAAEGRQRLCWVWRCSGLAD